MSRFAECFMIAFAVFCQTGVAALGQEKAAPKPGLLSIYFLGDNFTRPGQLSVHAQINHDTGDTIRDYSQLWLGMLKVPTAEEITFSAEADNGCRLLVDGKVLIDGWSTSSREGKLVARQGQLLPLRLEFHQNGGTAHMRLDWSWKGRPRESIPPTAFFYTSADEQAAKGMMGSKSGAAAATYSSRAYVYDTPEWAAAIRRPERPITLRPGPHLFLDDYLIESSQNLTRRVNSPLRDPGIANPIITGKEDRCFQPYFTVSRSPENGKFRIWYGAWRDDQSTSRSHIAYLESEDGIHWNRPPKILKDPAELQFGSEVLDEGPNYPDPAKRYKYSWWFGGGTRVAASPDGFSFTPLSPGVVLPHGHDISNIWRDPVRNRYVATVSEVLQLEQMNQPRRTTLQAVSDDLQHWSPKQIILAADDRYDRDVLQFYAMNGYLARGGLVIGMVKNLHDDWKAEGCPPGAYGIGSTSLAWTRDGETWVRDREIFFGPDPAAGAWDHAHAWIDEQLLVGKEVYLYYGGYKWGHKHNRFEERQIGLVKMLRDRYVVREAGSQAATLRTPPLILAGSALTVNADVGGELAVRLADASGAALSGFDWVSIHGDKLDHAVPFQNSLASLAGRPVRLEFRLCRARLFGFDLQK